MPLKLIFALCLLLASSCSGLAAVYYVDQSATGANNGSQWSDAFTHIQPAIDAAHAAGGGEVWVRSGTYSQKLGTLLEDGFEAINPNSVDILGTEHTLYFTNSSGNLQTVHASIYRLTGDVHQVPPQPVYAATTQSSPLAARFKDLATSNPDCLFIYNHPQTPVVPIADIIACANDQSIQALEIHGSPTNLAIWDSVLANLDDQSSGCRKIVWGVTADDKHDAANFGFQHYGTLMGTIPTTTQSPVYADRRLAFKDMIRRGSIVCVPPGAPIGMPTYSLTGYPDGSAIAITVNVQAPTLAGTTAAAIHFFGCDRAGGDITGGKLLHSVAVPLSGNLSAMYFLSASGSPGTLLTPQERANIKYIRPVLTRIIDGVWKDTYFQPVRLTHEGKWWNGPNYTLAGNHATIGRSPYPAGGSDTGQTVYMNSHCHSNASDGTHSPTTVRRRYADDLAKIDPGKPFFAILTDHDLFVPYPAPQRSVIQLKEGVHLFGGFSGTETNRDQRAPASNPTILDGADQSRCVYVDGSSWTDKQDATLDGFELRRGNASFASGGAVLNWLSSLTVRNCIFDSNVAGTGGAMLTALGNPTVENCTFTNSDADYAGGTIQNELYSVPVYRNCTVNGSSARRGGGICSNDATVTIIGGEVSDCSSFENGGGGIYVNGGALAVDGCRILRNSGTTMYSYGGGMRLTGSGAVSITNCLFEGNQVASGSFGAAILTTNPATITNNSFVNNGGAGSTGGIYIWNSSPKISNNIIAFNSKPGIVKYCTNNCSPVLRNNCVFGNVGGNWVGISPGDGDFSLDPLFSDLDLGDYHLQAGSPCRDQGFGGAPGIPVHDIDNQPRPHGAGVDIGFDEFWVTAAGLFQAKASAPGVTWAEVSDAVVTATLPGGALYIESEARQSGMRVHLADHTLVVDDKAVVSGVVRTNSDAELFIDARYAEKTGSGEIRPLAMSTRTMGGAAFGMQAGVESGTGLNNIGLLITLTGATGYIDATTFTLYDGGADPVKCIVAPGVVVDTEQGFARVTGISSCENDGGVIRRVLRVRNQADIQSLAP